MQVYAERRRSAMSALKTSEASPTRAALIRCTGWLSVGTLIYSPWLQAVRS
jgi:hypothetical protein